MTSDRNAPAQPETGLLALILKFARFVRFSHTVFALPFAFAGMALAVRETAFRWDVFGWVLAAMVTARSAAMGFNRIVDRRWDALNPRTAQRDIPAGRISVAAAGGFVALMSALFILSAFMLNPLCGWLSPLALAIVCFYSLTKRFTWTSQFFLGLSLAIAPVGAWMAQTGGLDLRILALSGAVLFWVAGFDIFYSLADLDFDARHGLLSVPRRWGVAGAIRLARLLHFLSAALILWTFWLFDLGWIYFAGALVIAVILAIEDSLVRTADTSKAMLAFNLNGSVSILFLAFLLLDLAL